MENHQPGEGDRAGETVYVRGHWGIENRLHYVRDVRRTDAGRYNVGELERPNRGGNTAQSAGRRAKP